MSRSPFNTTSAPKIRDTSNARLILSGNMACQECGQWVDGTEYHPFLYCVLYKAGIRDQGEWLRLSGWQRIPAPASTGEEETR